MKTEIKRFCETCLDTLKSLPPVLQGTIQQLDKAANDHKLEKARASFQDLSVRLRALVEKLANQQAHLLIFGPLKSGKSTLMNAISGSYVSEVTSLPGYPCLVYVHHSDEPRFSVTRYNGRESVFANALVLKDVIADSHIALAQQIRATERGGEEFDPRTHFTEAIRRIDVKVPVRSLADSSTVLVDTPGLYSRMNFGYDVLTREFRDSAACAVFVVKTDNLFLEQVFAEFNQLLDLFSRIFLVINVDSSKRDLQADGSLTPSAESQHPQQVIEAFKTLSMAGPLRQAYEQRRLRIHAVDLMNAASGLLRKDPPATENSEGAEDPQKAAFAAFTEDLIDYLNSSDYTLEFVRDSLRQGLTLCAEVREVFDGREVHALRSQQQALQDQLRGLDDQIAAADRLLAVDWDSTFEKFRESNRSRGGENVTAKSAQLAKEMRQALENWYENAESLKELHEGSWNRLLGGAASAMGQETRSRLRSLAQNPHGGSQPSSAVLSDLLLVGNFLQDAATAASSAFDSPEPVEPYLMAISEQSIPVRKSLLDWLLFRSVASLRRRIFGPDLANVISPEIKQRRFPDRAAFFQIIDQALRDKFPQLPARFSDSLACEYIKRFKTSLLASLQERRQALINERAERNLPFAENSRNLAAIEELNTQCGLVAKGLKMMAEKENVLPLPVDGFVPAPRPEPS